MREVYEEHSYVKEKLSDIEKEEYDKILMKAEDAEYGRALRNLTKYLHTYYQKKLFY